jgi:hypothetical protein
MKKILILLWFLALVSAANAQVTNTTVTLSWDYPPAEITNITFKSFGIATPMTNWTVIKTITATNQVTVPAVAGVNFFSVTASNFWGESFFSNVASTPALPRIDVALKVQR